ncbi:MAG TPA: 2-amino-4-hydroxy-6-hydroxymethyldihydropteridine diphosphokinase [Paludibacteraceae bacterium]|nr:2-amino-4-hydroxy-6-hydroxymethyldihydropteridine diphosphokinase [Paludibacteraceae bacterium]HQF49972.1 2-amino-4-hydroxy-6-hydroxymethyldihydropteridine diphosphokinase [Paludibacteraceae bacterium]HQJ89442.1 2-amino-4-hydroxy-6-hydroxymethyldihydropteridine diphosphokinase [Paludibacteraceae bacterium]
MQTTDTLHTYKLCAGSNTEEAQAILMRAINALREEYGNVKQTAIQKTKAIGTETCLYYENVGIGLESTLSPSDLKIRLKKMEYMHGRRKRDYPIVALDIDIIAVDGVIIHPDYEQRDYVKELMAELMEITQE